MSLDPGLCSSSPPAASRPTRPAARAERYNRASSLVAAAARSAGTRRHAPHDRDAGRGARRRPRRRRAPACTGRRRRARASRALRRRGPAGVAGSARGADRRAGSARFGTLVDRSQQAAEDVARQPGARDRHPGAACARARRTRRVGLWRWLRRQRVGAGRRRRRRAVQERLARRLCRPPSRCRCTIDGICHTAWTRCGDSGVTWGAALSA